MNTIIKAITYELESLVILTEIYQKNKQTNTSFHAVKIPKISLRDYIARLRTYMKCSDECFVLALIYVKRLKSRVEDFRIDLLSVHRLLLTGLTLATKFCEDEYSKNSYSAIVGGVSNKELNQLELMFLTLLDFKLYVSKDYYSEYRKSLIKNYEEGESLDSFKQFGSGTYILNQLQIKDT